MKIFTWMLVIFTLVGVSSALECDFYTQTVVVENGVEKCADACFDFSNDLVTPAGHCSSLKSDYCDVERRLQHNFCYGADKFVGTADDCGCPEGLVCQEDGSCVESCYDGTEEGECSTEQPKLCSGGEIVEDCFSCGCPEGTACTKEGSCEPSYYVRDFGLESLSKGTFHYRARGRLRNWTTLFPEKLTDYADGSSISVSVEKKVNDQGQVQSDYSAQAAVNSDIPGYWVIPGGSVNGANAVIDFGKEREFNQIVVVSRYGRAEEYYFEYWNGAKWIKFTGRDSSTYIEYNDDNLFEFNHYFRSLKASKIRLNILKSFEGKDAFVAAVKVLNTRQPVVAMKTDALGGWGIYTSRVIDTRAKGEIIYSTFDFDLKELVLDKAIDHPTREGIDGNAWFAEGNKFASDSWSWADFNQYCMFDEHDYPYHERLYYKGQKLFNGKACPPNPYKGSCSYPIACFTHYLSSYSMRQSSKGKETKYWPLWLQDYSYSYAGFEFKDKKWIDTIAYSTLYWYPLAANIESVQILYRAPGDSKGKITLLGTYKDKGRTVMPSKQSRYSSFKIDPIYTDEIRVKIYYKRDPVSGYPGYYKRNVIDQLFFYNGDKWKDDSIDYSGSSKAFFQIRSGNTEEEVLKAAWSGPNGGSKTYYKTSGQFINEKHNNHRFIQYRVQMLSPVGGNSVALQEARFNYVADEINSKPSVSAGRRIETVINEPVNFNAIGSDSDGERLSYSWNFGDSSFAKGNNIAHVYHSPGEYTATVVVRDEFGLEAEDSVVVDVKVYHCLEPVPFGPDPAGHYNLGDPLIKEKAIDALIEYAAYKKVPVESLDTADEYMEAVIRYVATHTTYKIVNDNVGDITSKWILTESYKIGCGNDYCGQCRHYPILVTSMLRELGVSDKCVYTALGSGHMYNVFMYKGKYRTVEPQNPHIESNLKSSALNWFSDPKYGYPSGTPYYASWAMSNDHTTGWFNRYEQTGRGSLSYYQRNYNGFDSNPSRLVYNNPGTDGMSDASNKCDAPYIESFYEDRCP